MEKLSKGCLMKHSVLLITYILIGTLGWGQLPPDSATHVAAAADPDARTLDGAGAAPGSSETQILTLQQAVQVALEKNPTVQAAGAYAEAVKRGIAVGESPRYPRVDFNENFTRGNNPVYVFGSLLEQRQFSAANFALPFLNVPPPLDNFQTAFTAKMPLYDAGQTSRMVKDARLQAQSASQDEQRTRQEVVFQVTQAYLNELLAKESVRVAQSAVDMSKSDLGRVQARQATGMAVPSDLLSAQVQLAQAEESLLRAQNAVQLARAALNVAMGLPEDGSTEIQGTLNSVWFQMPGLAELQKRALAVRPDYLEAEMSERRAQNGVSMARAELLPKVGLFSSWEMDHQTFATRGGNNWVAGAQLTFNIFDGGAHRAKLAESKAREIQAREMLAQMASQVQLQVREAYLNLQTARKRIQVTSDAVAQATESLRILENRYAAGLATMTDVLAVETARTAAQKSSLNAVYDYRVSYAALELATGELSAQSAAVTQ
jgi:outer membrane protein TolC